MQIFLLQFHNFLSCLKVNQNDVSAWQDLNCSTATEVFDSWIKSSGSVKYFSPSKTAMKT